MSARRWSGRIVTAPFSFLRPQQHGASFIIADTGTAYRALTPEAARLLVYALNPRTKSELAAAGFAEPLIKTALEDGILKYVNDPAWASSKIWESSNWSRAAYVLFSQFNIDYVETAWGGLGLDEHVEGRREQIRAYLQAEHYPERITLRPAEKPIELPVPSDGGIELRFDRLFARRSVRQFRSVPVALQDFTMILYGAGASVRAASSSQLDGDPFFLLNSFYSWLSLFVIVQAVEGIPEGTYQLDLERHQLIPLGPRASDLEIAKTIAGQTWIGGGGFCLFVAVDWLRYMWIYRHARAYIHLITQLGEFGQEVIQLATSCQLGGWMTPAVDEEAASGLLRCSDTRLDPMYFMKIGCPDR